MGPESCMSNIAPGDTTAAGGLCHIFSSKALQEHCKRKIITALISLSYPF